MKTRRLSPSRGKALSTPVRPLSPHRVASNREAAIIVFLHRARRLHLFSGLGTQCPICWGWYDDPRHL